MKRWFSDFTKLVLLGGMSLQGFSGTLLAQDAPPTRLDLVGKPLRSSYSWLTKLTVQTSSGVSTCGESSNSFVFALLISVVIF